MKVLSIQVQIYTYSSVPFAVHMCIAEYYMYLFEGQKTFLSVRGPWNHCLVTWYRLGSGGLHCPLCCTHLLSDSSVTQGFNHNYSRECMVLTAAHYQVWIK